MSTGRKNNFAVGVEANGTLVAEGRLVGPDASDESAVASETVDVGVLNVFEVGTGLGCTEVGCNGASTFSVNKLSGKGVY